MTRPIKFRAWDIELKKMRPVRVWDSWNDRRLWVGEENEVGTWLFPKEYVLMQYTGLKDRSGKEIYEGDVIDFDGSIEVVSYGLQQVDAFEGMGWNLWSFMEGINADGKRLQSEIEVIGNIYQNPELLK